MVKGVTLSALVALEKGRIFFFFGFSRRQRLPREMG